MELPMSVASIPLFSPDPNVVRSQLANLQSHRERLSQRSNNRQDRDALARSRRFIHSLPEEAAKFHDANPLCYGLPRSYKIFAVDNLVDGGEAKDHGHKISFGRFGEDNGGLAVNGFPVDPSKVKFSKATKICTWETMTPSGLMLSGHLNFNAEQPFGHIAVNDSIQKVFLEAHPLTFRVKVSAETDAAWSTGKTTLTWNTDSAQWKSANWEDTLLFSYNVQILPDPIEKRVAVENFFADTTTDDTSAGLFELKAEKYGSGYTCISSSLTTGTKSVMETDVQNADLIPSPPASRKGKVMSVFPKHMDLSFNAPGDHFDGAYVDAQGHVYAMSGNAIDPLADVAPAAPAESHLESLSAFARMLSDEADTKMLAAPTTAELAEQDAREAEKVSEVPAVAQFASVAAVTTPSATTVPLSATGLTNFNPVVAQPGGGYTDTISEAVMQDFYQIIVYHMDADLRELFISKSLPDLDPSVKAIALDSNDNAAFYKKLQTPYLASVLANSTIPEGKNCNLVRANLQLKTIPTDDPVYKRHSGKLYRMHYLKKFPSMNDFLTDQQSDKSADIAKIGKALKDNLDKQTAGLESTNDNFAQQLATTKAELDRLCKFATEKRLYWAFRLFYWIQLVSLPNWYAQYTSGQLGPGVQINIKNLTATLQILENDAVNTDKDGKSFTETFNDVIRLFQMTSVIPQMVDLQGNLDDVDSIVKECLQTFYDKYQGKSSDPEMLKRIEDTKAWLMEAKLRRTYLQMLGASFQPARAAGAWTEAVRLTQQRWILDGAFPAKLKTPSGMGWMACLSAIALVALPLIPGSGGYKALTSTEKAQFILSCVGLGTFAILKVAMGFTRLYAFWENISGFWNGMKVVMGFEKVLEDVPEAANRINNGFGKWFTRTGRQIATMEEEGVLIGYSEFSIFQRLFGRSAGEMVSVVAGIALAIVSLVLTAISLSKETDPYLIASDSLFLAASAVQILAFVAGWGAVLTAGAAAGSGLAMLGTVCTFVAAWGPILAIVVVAIGLIVFLVWFFKHKDDPPPNPVRDFVNSKVKDAGLYQEFMSIDYFTVIPASAGAVSKAGLSLQLPTSGCLRMDATGPTLNFASTVDYTPSTVWSVSTDYKGRTIIATPVYNAAGTERTMYCLGRAGDLISPVRLPSRLVPSADGKSMVAVAPEEYEKQMDAVRWSVTTVADPDKTDVGDGNEKHQVPTKAIAIISSGGKFLVEDQSKKGALVLGTALDLTRAVWTFQVQQMGPGNFKYQIPNWVLFTSSMDHRNIVLFDFPKDVSLGLTWTVNPPLPEPFELVHDGTFDDGTIRMKSDQKSPEMATTPYAVTCSLPGTNITSSAAVNISVQKDAS